MASIALLRVEACRTRHNFLPDFPSTLYDPLRSRPMKIRTQLVLAWFLLSILPLSVIVLYSYHSSRQALEAAYHKEAQQLTAQMDRRLTAIRTDIDDSLTALSALPLDTLPATKRTDPARAAVVDNILMAMGETAPLVDALEFVPSAAGTAVPVVARAPSAPAAPPPPAAAVSAAKIADAGTDTTTDTDI